MANEEHLAILRQGVEAWNQWRSANGNINPDLSNALVGGICLRGARLRYTNLLGADLHEANLVDSDLFYANMDRTNLSGAIFEGASLVKTGLVESRLVGADLSWSDLFETDFTRANLQGASLEHARLVRTRFSQANLSGCRVYGIAAWGLELRGAIQTGLIITPEDEPVIAVDSLEVAQFMYLLLHNEKITEAIDSIVTKVVLILGRFTEERKDVLDALRDALRQHGYVSVLFDFDPPNTRDLAETVRALAHMARFIIADLSDPRSIIDELSQIIPLLPSVPVQPLLVNSQEPYALFEHWERFPWVLGTRRYTSCDELVASLEDEIIAPAEAKVKELGPHKPLRLNSGRHGWPGRGQDVGQRRPPGRV